MQHNALWPAQSIQNSFLRENIINNNRNGHWPDGILWNKAVISVWAIVAKSDTIRCCRDEYSRRDFDRVYVVVDFDEFRTFFDICFYVELALNMWWMFDLGFFFPRSRQSVQNQCVDRSNTGVVFFLAIFACRCNQTNIKLKCRYLRQSIWTGSFHWWSNHLN